MNPIYNPITEFLFSRSSIKILNMLIMYEDDCSPSYIAEKTGITVKTVIDTAGRLERIIERKHKRYRIKREDPVVVEWVETYQRLFMNCANVTQIAR